MQYTREEVWRAHEADAIRRSLAAGIMEEEDIDDRAKYERGLELLKTVRVILSDRTTTPRMVDGTMWYEYDRGFSETEKISPVYVYEVGHIATAPAYVAIALAPRRYATANEAAVFTGTSESSWRNRAAAGQIPGALKKGKQWLIPWPQPGQQENQ